MKAIVQDRYGSADVLELRDVEKPQPEDDEVLIRVHAAGLDPGVWHLMTGLPYMVRVMGFGLRRPKIRIRGMDAAGCCAPSWAPQRDASLHARAMAAYDDDGGIDPPSRRGVT